MPELKLMAGANIAALAALGLDRGTVEVMKAIPVISSPGSSKRYLPDASLTPEPEKITRQIRRAQERKTGRYR